MAQPQLLLLAHVVDVGLLGDGHDLLELVELAAALEKGLQLEVAVEVVLDRTLPHRGDDDDVLDARSPGLVDEVLDGGPVDDGQHLLGLGLGRREETRAEAGGGDDSLAHGHQAPHANGGYGGGADEAGPESATTRRGAGRGEAGPHSKWGPASEGLDDLGFVGMTRSLPARLAT